MSEIFPENSESDTRSGLEIIRDREFQLAVANANYELNAYMDDPDQRIDEIKDELLSFFPENTYTQTVDFIGMGYEYDEEVVTGKNVYSISNAEFLGIQTETIEGQEKIVLQFLLPDSDDLNSGVWFCVEPIPEDVAIFEFREGVSDVEDDLVEELSRQAHTAQAMVRSKDFLSLSIEAQEEALHDLSCKLIELFDFLKTDSRSLIGIKCSGYYSTSTEIPNEIDLEEYYVDLGDNPDISYYPEGKLMDVGLPEKFLNHDTHITKLDDLYFSGGVPFIILKPNGLEHYYWINIKEIEGLVWSIDSPSQFETGMSE